MGVGAPLQCSRADYRLLEGGDFALAVIRGVDEQSIAPHPVRCQGVHHLACVLVSILDHPSVHAWVRRKLRTRVVPVWHLAQSGIAGCGCDESWCCGSDES